MDSLSTSIAACWRHAHCLGVVEIADLSTMPVEYRKKVESESVDMCMNLLNLKLSEPSVMCLLKRTGLDEVAQAAQSVCRSASGMLLSCLQFEENGMIDIEEEEEDVLLNDQVLERFLCLNELLPQLRRVHKIGVKANDDFIMNAAVELCLHIASVCKTCQFLIF